MQSRILWHLYHKPIRDLLASLPIEFISYIQTLDYHKSFQFSHLYYINLMVEVRFILVLEIIFYLLHPLTLIDQRQILSNLQTLLCSQVFYWGIIDEHQFQPQNSKQTGGYGYNDNQCQKCNFISYYILPIISMNNK